MQNIITLKRRVSAESSELSESSSSFGEHTSATSSIAAKSFSSSYGEGRRQTVTNISFIKKIAPVSPHKNGGKKRRTTILVGESSAFVNSSSSRRASHNLSHQITFGINSHAAGKFDGAAPVCHMNVAAPSNSASTEVVDEISNDSESNSKKKRTAKLAGKRKSSVVLSINSAE